MYPDFLGKQDVLHRMLTYMRSIEQDLRKDKQEYAKSVSEYVLVNEKIDL